MPVTLSQVRTALADQLKANIDRTVNVYDYKPPVPQFPCIAITAGDPYVSYDRSFAGPGGLRLASVALVMRALETSTL